MIFDNKSYKNRYIIPSHITLNRRFLVAIVIILACSLSLGLTLIAGYYRALDANRTSLAKLMAFRHVINAANSISAERGPTNSVLGEEPLADSPSRQRLSQFRATSDLRLVRTASIEPLAEAVRDLQRSLALARQKVDALARLPFAARSNADIERVVETMFGVFDATQPLIDKAMTELIADAPELISRALVARMLSELREHAGRLGSHLVIPIAHGEPISTERRAAFEQTRGRVIALWQLARQQTGTSSDARLAAAHQAVVARFFGDGMSLLERTLDAGNTGRFGLSTAEFTNAIVPHFGPLEQLRDVFLDVTITRLQAQDAAARGWLTAVTVATALVLVLEFLLLVASQRLLFRPLLAARDRIVALADGKVDEPITSLGMKGEMLGLFQALDTLRRRLIDRNALDRERATFAAQLKRQADTDGLTGVLNRGALERLAARLTQQGSGPARIGLILLDIDRFKAINDSFGHAAGDDVLKQAATRLRAALRQDDVIARFGGEEFAILLLGQDIEPPLEIAERLRRTLQSPRFELDTGQTLEVTASFGAALIENEANAWPRLVAAADRALYLAKDAGRNRVVVDGDTA